MINKRLDMLTKHKGLFMVIVLVMIYKISSFFLHQIPKWTRGEEWGEISVPMWNTSRSMMLLALGTSIGTNGTNFTGTVIVVRSFVELWEKHALGQVNLELVNTLHETY